MITLPGGKIVKPNPGNIFKEQWQTLPPDEFLYRYLLANTALKACDEGLPDEEHKALKHFGIKYWEPGMEEVKFEGKVYKTVIR